MNFVRYKRLWFDKLMVRQAHHDVLYCFHAYCERIAGGNGDPVSSGQVRVIDDSLLNRPGPRLSEGAQRLFGWMFEVLH